MLPIREPHSGSHHAPGFVQRYDTFAELTRELPVVSPVGPADTDRERV